ncbi:MAG: hypothetical protein E7D25_22715 [Klebsiella sp.]|uniref:hypothetical protein n=1 Tax=Klebsiella sp. TaxID=576 RepID=UPI0028FF0D76|nr:hypothetical protein [Klebsiella sp.]MDU2513376.1 hypothetical protein [Klebsiella sp.]
MKELSMVEMDCVSGAADTPGWGTGYIWDFSSAQSAITSLANNLFQAGAGLIEHSAAWQQAPPSAEIPAVC